MKSVFLSFDVEEFDMPLEYGASILPEEQLAVSTAGTEIILDLLREDHILATFFCTAHFATQRTGLIQRIVSEGHEIASHGYFHSAFVNEHFLESRLKLEMISGKPVHGFRMARMMPVDNKAIESAGYLYNSSLNPVYLPGRYNNFFKPRTPYMTNSLVHLPASATPYLRLPLFWLSFHHLPAWLYQTGCRLTMNSDALRVVHVCARLLNDAELGVELAQETWVTVWTQRAHYRREGKFVVWLVTVARNRCRNRLRQQGVVRRHIESNVRSEATTPDQIDRLLEEERRRHVRNALAQLPEAMREALLLRYAEELRYDEMSNLLAVSESTLRSRVHHGLKLLRERLENGS